MLRNDTITIGDEDLAVREMSAKCYVEMMDAQDNGKPTGYVNGLIAKYCIPEWRDRDIDDILSDITPAQLAAIVTKVVELSRDEDPNSNAGQHVDSSAA